MLVSSYPPVMQNDYQGTMGICTGLEKRVLKDARTTARVIQTALICPYGPLDLSSTPKTGSEMEGFIMKRGGPPLTPPSPRLARLALSNKCLARSDRSRPNSTG